MTVECQLGFVHVINAVAHSVARKVITVIAVFDCQTVRFLNLLKKLIMNKFTIIESDNLFTCHSCHLAEFVVHHHVSHIVIDALHKELARNRVDERKEHIVQFLSLFDGRFEFGDVGVQLRHVERDGKQVAVARLRFDNRPNGAPRAFLAFHFDGDIVFKIAFFDGLEVVGAFLFNVESLNVAERLGIGVADNLVAVDARPFVSLLIDKHVAQIVVNIFHIEQTRHHIDESVEHQVVLFLLLHQIHPACVVAHKTGVACNFALQVSLQRNHKHLHIVPLLVIAAGFQTQIDGVREVLVRAHPVRQIDHHLQIFGVDIIGKHLD